MAVTTEKSVGATAIRPFTIEIPEAELEALRARTAATRWPEKETVADASRGGQSATIQELARSWGHTLGFFDVKGVFIPAAVSVLPRELYQAPRTWTGAGLPQPHLLQRSRQRQPLRGLAGAGDLHDRGASRIQVTALRTQATNERRSS
jgi:Epoxide hydrolase N terminus